MMYHTSRRKVKSAFSPCIRFGIPGNQNSAQSAGVFLAQTTTRDLGLRARARVFYVLRGAAMHLHTTAHSGHARDTYPWSRASPEGG